MLFVVKMFVKGFKVLVGMDVICVVLYNLWVLFVWFVMGKMVGGFRMYL